ncbi:MAG: GNAT family N-acetyltransferase [Actinobacteria bacterium]|nr:GNAT family N-acetyltransferase [Actinomycetota bacterium]
MSAFRLARPDVLERSTLVAEAAASKAGVVVRDIDSQAHIDAAIELFSSVWGADGSEPVMTASLARAFIHSGNYFSAAFMDGAMVGASVGFLGHDGKEFHLHSHVTGVGPSLQARGVGYALKQHQRAWALDKGLSTIRWTFDPLVCRNGYFNISKLGADIIGYYANFYGAMQDGINRDDESDRCVVSWRLDSSRADDAAEGRDLEPAIDAGASKTLLGPSSDGSPVIEHSEADTLLVFIPRDIVPIRANDPDMASAWRRTLREAFEWAFGRGYRVTGMTKFGCYVLGRST